MDAAASAVAARLAGLTTALQAAEPSAADEAAHQLVAELRNCAATLKALAEARHALSPHHAH